MPGMSQVIQDGTTVLFFFDARRTYLRVVRGGEKFHTHKGILDMDQAIGLEFGDSITTHMGQTVYLLEPTLEDLIMKVQRRTQIIYPKEAAMILMKTGIRKGHRVLEVGCGSGALTMALAAAVGDTGQVFSYDRREDHLAQARKNVAWMQMANTIQFKPAETPDRFEERDIDVAVVDVPEPWAVVDPVYDALKGGGRWVSLSPTYNQVEKAAMALQAKGFVFMETIEVLTRTILAREGRTRPFERMVGHTGFLTFGRKVRYVVQPAAHDAESEPEGVAEERPGHES